MDRVQRGGPWTVSTGMVHGPGVHVLYTPEVRLLSQVLGPYYKGSEFPRRLCDPLPQYDFIMSAVTLPCKYSTSSATSSEVIENLAACS